MNAGYAGAWQQYGIFYQLQKCCIKDGNRNATGTGFCIYQFYTLMLIFSGRSLIAAAYILYMKEQVL